MQRLDDEMDSDDENNQSPDCNNLNLRVPSPKFNSILQKSEPFKVFKFVCSKNSSSPLDMQRLDDEMDSDDENIQ
jgi:hypothetical protein